MSVRLCVVFVCVCTYVRAYTRVSVTLFTTAAGLYADNEKQQRFKSLFLFSHALGGNPISRCTYVSLQAFLHALCLCEPF